MPYLAASGRYPSGFRLWTVWPAGLNGPWLTLEVTVVDQDATLELSHHLTAFNEPRDTARARLLEILRA